MKLRTTIAPTLLLLLSASLLPRAVEAGGSAPALSITSATPIVTAAGVRAVAVVGTFNFDDLLQFSFPAGAIVSQGTHFVRYDVSGRVAEGNSPIVADGIADTEIPGLLGLGTAADAPARVVQMGVQKFVVALPADFTAGSVSVVLYAELESDPFVSNSVALSLP